MARNGDKQFVVVGGKKSEEFDGVEGLAFTTQGKVIYAARNNPFRHIVVVGDQRTEEAYDYEFMSPTPTFSPSGKAIAYYVTQDNFGSDAYFAVGRKKSEVASTGLIFSPDETTIAYILRQNRKQFIVMGDQKGEGFDAVGMPAFSPDGKTLAYRATNGVDNRAKSFIVLGGQKAEEFDWVSDPVFSRDGRKVAYGAVKGRELWWKVIEVKP
jgi:Tol biopolymer transport system component